MKLIYDNLIYELQKAGGISTYWYELTRRILLDKEIAIQFIEAGNAQQNVLRKELNLDPSTIEISNRGGILFERFKRVILNKVSPDTIFHSSLYRVPLKKTKVKRVATIHDFTHDMFYSKPRAFLHNITKSKAIQESDAIIVVSENTKRDLLKYYDKADASRIKVIYNGVSEVFREIDKEADAAESRPYLLYVGSREPYKNFGFAVKLTAMLKDFELCIVGSALSKIEMAFVDKHLDKRYRVVSGVSIEELNKLYNNAFSLIYPSSYEGFGIPLLEAMRAACPFIAIRNSSIPEVAGDAGVLLSQLSLEEARQAMDTIANNRKTIIEKGKLQSAKFSWDTCYNETIKLYREL